MRQENGDVMCDKCCLYLGNIYYDGDYFSLIRIQYCPSCKAETDRKRKREWAKKRREKARLKKKLIKEKNELLREENELLRKKIMELKEKGV